MTKELDPNFKKVFSFELLLHRIENTKSENEQYSKILLEKTIAGLDAQGKITIKYSSDGKGEYAENYVIVSKSGDEWKEIADKLTNAVKIYKDIANKMGSARADVTGRSYMDGRVLEMCHMIDAVIYPLAMSEGLLDMSQTLEDFRDQFAAKSEDDE